MNTYLKRFFLALFLSGFQVISWAQEITVVGSRDQALDLLDADRWWEKREKGQRLEVPHTLVLAITGRWQNYSSELPVEVKKEIFFSSLLPLVVHANTIIIDRRKRLEDGDARLAAGESLSDGEIAKLRDTAVLLRIASAEEASQMKDSADFRKVIKESLYKLDVIPPGLVLGQAAYESGYATSRFAAQGNALFGQWTFGGEGLVPEQQRKELGDHRIASFEWPFDSVRGYFLNLSSNPAYEDFRRLRAELKASDKPLTSLRLADGLLKYSERGQAYVDTLKGIIKKNALDSADNAEFRDEPVNYLWGAEDEAAAKKLEKEIEFMRQTGELSTLIDRMKLD